MTEMSYIQILLGLAITFLFGYLLSYFKEKGKNSALISTIKVLTEEKEKIKSDYKMDVEKRKYKYEAKREQYFKYFNLINQFNAQANKDVLEKFNPIVNEFNEKFLGANGNKNKETIALKIFSSKVNKLISESNQEHLRIKNETETIKLIAGQKVLKLLQTLEGLYNYSFEKGGQFMKEMGANVIGGKSSILEKQQAELNTISQLISEKRQELINEVRRELDEI